MDKMQQERNLLQQKQLPNEAKDIADHLEKVFYSYYADKHFTGVNTLDLLIHELKQPTDPNLCTTVDVLEEDEDGSLEKRTKTTWKNSKKCKKEKQNKHGADTKSKQPEQEYITIQCDVKNIADVLKIIEDHPYDAKKTYNIDMKSLHNIKDPLLSLQSMVGMKSLKDSVVDQILFYIQGLHDLNKGCDFMHTVIYGPPGSGKTEIAKIIGTIFSKLGILKEGTFKKVTRSDLVAGYLGQTALKTKDVIKDATGGVLFIDEAYSLGNPEKRDIFSKECIDTLCEALSDNKDNLMVIIAGYEHDLNDCFFSYNQGLDSRFPWRFKTDDYTPEDLYQIFLRKVAAIGWSVSNDKFDVEWFRKNKEYFKFYGRDIETLLAKAKIVHGRRVFSKPPEMKKILTLSDMNQGFELFLKNEEVKKRKESACIKESLSYMYL